MFFKWFNFFDSLFKFRLQASTNSETICRLCCLTGGTCWRPVCLSFSEGGFRNNNLRWCL